MILIRTKRRPLGPAGMAVWTDSRVASRETGGSETAGVQGAARVSDHSTVKVASPGAVLRRV